IRPPRGPSDLCLARRGRSRAAAPARPTSPPTAGPRPEAARSWSAPGREDEGIEHEHLAAALRDREPPGLDPRGHALLHRVVLERGLLRVRLGHDALRVDGPAASRFPARLGLVVRSVP